MEFFKFLNHVKNLLILIIIAYYSQNKPYMDEFMHYIIVVINHVLFW